MLSVALGDANAAFQQETGGRGIVSMEAENATSVMNAGGKSWSTRSRSGASGGTTMVSLPDSGTVVGTGDIAGAARLDFDIEFVTSGTHYVWLRGYARSSGSNSAYIGLDSVPNTSHLNQPSPYRSLGWTGNARTINVSGAGAHTLSVWMREDGYEVDKVVVTTDPAFVPTGTGPGESPPASGGGGGGGNPPPPDPGGEAFQQEVGGQGIVSMEAENAFDQTSAGGKSWSSRSRSGASGGTTMVSLPDSGTTIASGNIGNSPKLSFNVDFAATGTHYLWVRGYARSAGSNSAYAGLNNQPASGQLTQGSPFRTLAWSVAPLTVSVGSTGVHEVNLWMREDGFEADKLVLSTDASFVPTGTGPAQSPTTDGGGGGGGGGADPDISQNFSGGNASGWVTVQDTNIRPDWRVVNGAYRQQEFVGRANDAVDGIYHLGTYSYYSDGSGLTDYRYRVRMTLLSEDGDECGIMWRYQNNSNYYRLSSSYRDGITLVQKKVSGRWTTLAKNGRGMRPNDTLQIAIEAQGELTHILIDGAKVFAFRDTSLSSGTVAVYGRNDCAFDDVLVDANSNGASIAIAKPEDFMVLSATSISVSAVVRNKPAGATVDFELDNRPCSNSNESSPGLFQAVCSAPQVDVYTLRAELRQQGGALLDTDTRDTIGLGGENSVSAGDSVFNGRGDGYEGDGSPPGGWRVSRQGYQSNLMELLNGPSPVRQAHQVFNAAVGGDNVQRMLGRMDTLLEQHADADSVQIMIGVNDAAFNSTPVNTFRTRLQNAVNPLAAAGKQVRVATVTPVFGDDSGWYTNAGNVTVNRDRISGYNNAIQNQLNNTQPGPDLYDFLINRIDLYEDSLHPNALGHRAIGYLWRNVLTGSGGLPYLVSNIEVRLSQGGASISPMPYKQNLLEEGDLYYADDDLYYVDGDENVVATLVQVPSVLNGGNWIMTYNSHRDQGNSNYLTFDVGSGSSADVYVAYDAGATRIPTWLSQDFTPVGQQVRTTHGSAPVLNLYRMDSVPGNGVVQLPGANANANGAGGNYVVIVVPR